MVVIRKQPTRDPRPLFPALPVGWSAVRC